MGGGSARAGRVRHCDARSADPPPEQEGVRKTTEAERMMFMHRTKCAYNDAPKYCEGAPATPSSRRRARLPRGRR